MKQKILVIDDEANIRKVITKALNKVGYDTDGAQNGHEALSKFSKKKYDLVLSDYRLPGDNGETILEQVKAKDASIPFILFTGYGSIELAVNAMKKGAYTFLVKPVNLDVLISVVNEALRLKDDSSKDEPYGDHFMNIIGKSDAIREVFDMVMRVSKTDANILILGESGTGKELLARAIHYSSHKCGGPFIPLDCTTIPTELVESELFGYEKGAFTCAYDNKIGLIEMSHGGTIFLDEIGDLDYALQKKLLRFLQEKEFFRVGGKKKIKVDVRVLAATNRNIEEAIANGDFRSDLYYRLNVITISMPPLRERKNDIDLLASHFLKVFCAKNKKDIKGIDENVMRTLNAYDWPGNVRELGNIIERAVILCPYDRIMLDCLPLKLKNLSLEGTDSEGEYNLSDIEKNIIVKALHETSWNQTKAADLLGISRKQLRTKMKNHSLFDSVD